MKPLVIYHANCLDGFASAWCFHHEDPEGYDFYPGVYQKPPPSVKDREVYLVDFSYKSTVVAKMAREAASITILDHHKTAIEDLNNWAQNDEEGEGNCPVYFVFKPDRSGVGITWDYLFPGQPMLNTLMHIEDRDLWKFSFPDTEAVTAALSSYPEDFDAWDDLTRMSSTLKLEGKPIIRLQEQYINSIISSSLYFGVLAGYSVPMINIIPQLASKAGNILCQSFESSAFSVCYNDSKDKRHFSLRSLKGNKDVSEVAKLFGGGGHENAAGFSIPFSDIEAWNLIKKM